jgi:hypothetical protein
LLFAGAVAATDWQRYEIYAGYDRVKFNPNSAFIPAFNANSGRGQFVYRCDKWIGAAFGAGAVTNGVLNGQTIDTTVASFTAGPRFTWHREARWKPFVAVFIWWCLWDDQPCRQERPRLFFRRAIPPADTLAV